MKQEFELAFSLAELRAKFSKAIPVVSYVPAQRVKPERGLERSSAWSGLEMILADIIERFDVPRDRCLEFGVEYGFSTIALSSFFASVTGVDTFQGDRHTNNIQNIYEETTANVQPYSNIRLVKSDYRDYIRKDQSSYDLIHVDIIHTFKDTYACGLWSAQHSKCTIFHDTESFPQVKRSVMEIARKTGKTFYNFPEFYGLGILA